MAIAARLGSGDLEEVRRALEELSELDDTVEIAAHAGAAVAHLGPERDVCLAALDVLHQELLALHQGHGLAHRGGTRRDGGCVGGGSVWNHWNRMHVTPSVIPLAPDGLTTRKS